MEPVGPLLRVSKVAKLTDCSRNTIYKLIRAGTFPHLIVGQSIRIPAVSLQKWIDDRTRNGATVDRDAA